MKAQIERLLIPGLIGFAPVLILLLTWDSTGVNSPLGRGIREYALPVLFVEGVVVGLALVSGSMSILRQPRPLPAILVVIWLVVAWTTALRVAPAPDLSSFFTGIWMLHLAFGLAIAHLVKKGEIDAELLVAAILAGFIAYATALAVFALLIDDPANFEWVRALPGLGNIRRFGAYATAIIGLCAGLFALYGRPRIWPIAAASIAFAIAFWSASRGTLLAAVLGFVACWFLFPKMRRPDVAVALLISGLIGLALAWSFPVPMEGAGAGRMIADQSLNGRGDVWAKVFDEIVRRPWFGNGEGQTAMILPRDPEQPTYYAHAHNLVLQLLFAWGIVGAICVGLFAWTVARPILRQARAGDARLLPMMGGAAAMLVHSMVDGALYDVAPVALFAAIIGSAAGLAHIEPVEASEAGSDAS